MVSRRAGLGPGAGTTTAAVAGVRSFVAGSRAATGIGSESNALTRLVTDAEMGIVGAAAGFAGGRGSAFVVVIPGSGRAGAVPGSGFRVPVCEADARSDAPVTGFWVFVRLVGAGAK